METRRMEYQRLKSLLEEKNMLEREMTLSEMRELANILEQSEKDFVDDEENWSIPSIPSSLKSKENEMEFEDGYVQEICNSTMISAQDQPSATQLHLESRELGEDALPFNSPDRPSRIFTIRAEVHRSVNWSPPRERRGPDFTGGGDGGGGDAENTRNAPVLIMARHNPKQQQVEPVPECLRNDSGVNCSNNTSEEISGSIVDDSMASSVSDHTGGEESHASAAEDSRASAEESVDVIDLTHIDYDEDEENTSL